MCSLEAMEGLKELSNTFPSSATKKLRVLQYLLQLLLFSCLETVARGTNVRLQPTDLTVDVGTWATFNCTISCELRDTHTVRWFVGHSPNSRRLVDANFHDRTGIQVELRDIVDCGEPGTGDEVVTAQQQQLSVNITSVKRLNRTAIQCAALRKGPNDSDLYSHYGVILVNDELEEPTPTSESSVSSSVHPSQTGTPSSSYSSPGSTMLLDIEPSHCPTVAVTVSVSETHMVTVTKTVMVTNTPPPSVARAALGSSKGISASLLLTLILVSLSFLIQLRRL